MWAFGTWSFVLSWAPLQYSWSQIFTSVSCQWMEPGRSLEYDPRFFWAIMSCWVALAGWLLNLPDVVLWEELGTLWSPWSPHPCDLRGCLLTQLYCRVNPWEAHKSPLGPSCFLKSVSPIRCRLGWACAYSSAWEALCGVPQWYV